MLKQLFPVSMFVTLAAMTVAPASASAIECSENNSFVIAIQELDESPGARFAVLPAKSACIFNEQDALFVIGSEDEPLWFEDLSGHHLVLSRSTGPQGDLVIYDLNTKSNVLDVPSDDFEIIDDGVVFWERVEEGTSQNCPQFSEYEKDGLGAAIVESRRFDFASGNVQSSDEQRCDATQ